VFSIAFRAARSAVLPAAFLTVFAAALPAAVFPAPAAAVAEPPPGATPFQLQAVGIEGRRSPVDALLRDGVVLVSVNDLSKLLGISYTWTSELGRIALHLGDHEVRVLDGSDIALIDGKQTVHLPARAFLWEGRMIVPIDVVVDERGGPRPWVPFKVRFFREERLLTCSERGGGSITEVAVHRTPQGYELVLQADGRFRAQVTRRERASFVVRLDGTTFDGRLTPLPEENRWFEGLRFRPIPGAVEMTFAVGPGVLGYRVTTSPGGDRLAIFLGVDERDLREGTLHPFRRGRSAVVPRVQTVALDPGRGEAGAADDLGRVASDICRRVAARLNEELGITVILPRNEGKNPPPEMRAERANRAGVDLFLSLHVEPRTGGPAAFVARMPGVAPRPTPEMQGLGFRAFFSLQEPVVPVSRTLARTLIQSVSLATGADPLGVFEVSLAELQGAAMPAVLLEIGAGGEGLPDASRAEVAEGIVEGLRLFLTRGEDGR